MKKVNLFLLLLALSLFFAPVAFAQDEEPTPDPTGEGKTVTVVDEDGNEVEAVITPFVEEPPIEDGKLDLSETAVQALMAGLAVVVTISQIVSGLKKHGKIGKDFAPVLVARLSIATSTIIKILTFLGAGEKISGIEGGGAMVAEAVVVSVLFVLGSNIVYWIGKKTGNSYSFSDSEKEAKDLSPGQIKAMSAPGVRG